MRRILALMRPVRLARAPALSLLVAAASTLAACGADEATPEAKPIVTQLEQVESDARVEPFVDAPNYAGLIALLGQRHELAREQLGPHRLRYTATLTTGPALANPDEPLPTVAVDQPIYERFVVTDELELIWASKPGEPPRMSLDQHNEHEHGRALILLDERAWSKLDGRGWLERPVEANLWRLWADDAQHAVLDLVELAGPHAEIGEIALEDLDGHPSVRVSLRPSEQRHPERTVEGPTPWRHGAEVRVIAATIVLDRATGLWRSASIELDWTFEDSAGRELQGHARFDGTVEVLAKAPMIAPPATSKPVPERDRPELLQERLLDGLAGP